MKRALLAPPVLYATWLGMLCLHELGHVLHAWASGGGVASLSVPLLGFSQTIVHPNPHERFVAWGGPLWGCLIPLIAFAIARFTRRRVPEPLRFFAGFCLIANGAYLGLGWTFRAGDAGDLLRLGTPRWLLIAFGLVATAAGLALWHRSTWLTFRT
jgi:hypothetical protein